MVVHRHIDRVLRTSIPGLAPERPGFGTTGGVTSKTVVAGQRTGDLVLAIGPALAGEPIGVAPGDNPPSKQHRY